MDETFYKVEIPSSNSPGMELLALAHVNLP